MDKKLRDLVEQTVDYAQQQGAQQVAAGVSRSKFVDLEQREGEIEKLQASTSRGLSLALYVDGRFSSNSTGLLEQNELRNFVDQTLSMTRRLAQDPDRRLPDKALYGPTEGVDLDLVDDGYNAVDMDFRREQVNRLEENVRKEAVNIISVTSEMVTQKAESLQIHSNGFFGETSATSFVLGTSVTLADTDERRPAEHCWTVARHLEDLPAVEEIGAEAIRRAIQCLSSKKIASGRYPMVVENRCAGRLLASLLEPLSAAAIYQGRSCFIEELGTKIASPTLTLTDEPLLKRGLASRLYDGEGLAARRLPVFAEGYLQNYFIDVYYGRKLKAVPTTGSSSNLVLASGETSRDALISQVESGVYVTGFLGGNSNPATGDFSLGVKGVRIEQGKLTDPVNEMNITGSHKTLWKRLVGVANDPYPYSSVRIPTILFEDVQFSGM